MRLALRVAPARALRLRPPLAAQPARARAAAMAAPPPPPELPSGGAEAAALRSLSCVGMCSRCASSQRFLRAPFR
jgi:hypothetical protein